jgi:hypothetical protein
MVRMVISTCSSTGGSVRGDSAVGFYPFLIIRLVGARAKKFTSNLKRGGLA